MKAAPLARLCQRSPTFGSLPGETAGSRAQSCGGPFDGCSVRTGWHLQFLKRCKRWGRHLDPSLFTEAERLLPSH